MFWDKDVPPPTLEDIKARFTPEKLQQEDTPVNGLPLINGETYRLLLATYKVPNVYDGQPLTTRLQEAITYSYRTGLEIAASTMSFFQEGAEREPNGMFFQTCQWLDSTYSPYAGPQFPVEFKDAATVGLTMVFKAFQIQLLNRDFLETLRKAQPKLLCDAFNKKNEPYLKKIAIVDRLRNSDPNPKHQVFLEDFLERFKTYCVPSINYENAFIDGALKGYIVAETVWNSLPKEEHKEA